MTYRKSLAVALSLLLILIMGSMYLSYASHIPQHAQHHTPATHSTGVCSWMCAAAHSISGDDHIISHSFQLVALMEWALPEFPSLISTRFLPTRAPPR